MQYEVSCLGLELCEESLFVNMVYYTIVVTSSSRYITCAYFSGFCLVLSLYEMSINVPFLNC